MYFVTIRDNQSRELRTIKYDDEWDYASNDEGSASEYIWTDGNEGCDCNRELLFTCKKPDPFNLPQCGTTRYSIRIHEDAEQTRILYQDPAWDD